MRGIIRFQVLNWEGDEFCVWGDREKRNCGEGGRRKKEGKEKGKYYVIVAIITIWKRLFFSTLFYLETLRRTAELKKEKLTVSKTKLS